MSRAAEATLFLGIAAAAHAGAFALFSGGAALPGRAEAEDGQRVTIAATAPGLAVRVADWRRAPAALEATKAPAPRGGGDTPFRPAAEVPPELLEQAAALRIPAPSDGVPRGRLAPSAPAVALPVAAPAAKAPTPGAAPAVPAGINAPAAPVVPTTFAARASSDALPSTFPPPAADPALLQAWRGEIRARIDRQARAAGPLGATGRTVLRLVVAPDGALIEARLLSSSGSPSLDAAAVEAVRGAGRLPPAPAGFSQAEGRFDLPVTFTR